VDLNVEHDDDMPLRFRTLSNILGSSSPPGQVGCALGDGLLLVVGDEPTTFEEAYGEESWRKAMIEEMASIEQNGTWVLVDLC
jgi:hypothetical protein